MASILCPCAFFHLLLLLCMIHGNLGRELPKDKEFENDDHLRLNHVNNNDGATNGCNNQSWSSSSSSSSHMDHMELTWNILFRIEDLELGKKMKLYFLVKNSSQTAHFIPKQEADSIPFSSSETDKILDFFSFDQDSPQSRAIQETLNHCELPPLKGETKFCATSLEFMLEKLSLSFGEATKFKVLTTTQLKNWTPRLQNYTILEEPREITVGKMFGCHPLAYPYAVYYCHSQEGENKLFMVSLEGEDGIRLDALAICHMDTSQWDPNHVSFRVLGVKPGTVPVCHVFPQDNLVWVSSPSYGN
ncbi:hypothetical protein vseg_006830 [Gypsophila vaccaria]